MKNVMAAATIITVLLTFLFAPACYTLFKHPRVKNVVYEEVNDNQCSNCHSQDEIWDYHHSPTHPDRYAIGYNWLYFYDVPWWYDAYWYYVDENDPSTIPAHSRALRPAATNNPAGYGGAVIPPSTSDPTKNPLRTEKEDAQDGKSNEKPSKKRTVRPSGKKQNDKGKKEKEKG